MSSPKRILLAEPRGFCAGVERAIEIVEKALEKYGAPIYVRHEIVHNKWVVADLKAKGVIFVKEVDEIPDGGVTVFSAHGISEKVENEAKLRALPVLDATCPLVTKVHNQARRYEKNGAEIILIGHAGHPEVEGTSGRVNKVHLVEDIGDIEKLAITEGTPLAYVTQTTLSVDDTKEIIITLKQRFPEIAGPDVNDICYATQNRQNAVRELAKQIDVLIVIGSQKSSNSNRLRDLGEEEGVPSYLIDDAAELNPAWIANAQSIGITAGASAPERLVERLIEYISTLHEVKVERLAGEIETIRFNLPSALRHN